MGTSNSNNNYCSINFYLFETSKDCTIIAKKKTNICVQKKKEDVFYLQLRFLAYIILFTNKDNSRLIRQKYQKKKVGLFKNIFYLLL